MKSEFLAVAIEAAKRAEEIILRYYQDEIQVSLKTDKTPVTLADQESEKIIIETIRAKFPTHSFLGEESGSTEREDEYLWVIDPIDGTHNYMRKIPLFATQIALMKNSEVIVGVSNAPALKEFMYAERGRGAYLNDKKVSVSSISNLADSYMCFGGLKHFEKVGKVQNLLKLVRDTRGHRGIGDFWCYHLLAQGKIDSMTEASTKLWDIAALSLIVEEAGGKISDIDGNKLTQNVNSLIATNGHIHDAIVDYFS